MNSRVWGTNYFSKDQKKNYAHRHAYTLRENDRKKGYMGVPCTVVIFANFFVSPVAYESSWARDRI